MEKSIEKSSRTRVYEINKAPALKRLAAWLIDMIIVIVLASGFTWLGSMTYSKVSKNLDQKYIEHGIYLPDSTQPSGYKACELKYDDNGVAIETDSCTISWKAFYADEEAVKLTRMANNCVVANIGVGTLIAVLLVEFMCPLLFKKTQATPGYWIMHIGIIGKDCIKAKPLPLFARAVIGRWAIEVMVPVLCVLYIMSNIGAGLYGTIALFVFVLVEACFMAFTKNRVAIHDAISNTVPVDADQQYFAIDATDLQNRIREDL